MGSIEGIKLGLSYGEVMYTTLVGVDGIKIWGDEGSDMSSSDGSFDGSNYGNLLDSFIGHSLVSEVETELGSFYNALEGNEDGILGISSLGDSLGYNYLFVLGCNGGIKLGLSSGKVTDV